MRSMNMSSLRTLKSFKMSSEHTRSTRRVLFHICVGVVSGSYLTIITANTGGKAGEMQDAVCDSNFDGHTLISPHTHRDNLEFLQWAKRFWDQSYGGQGYDAVARRRGAPTDTPATIAPLAPSRGAATLGTGGVRTGGRTPVGGHRAGSTQPNEAVQNLQAQVREMSAHLEGLEKERDFYFTKVGSTLYICPCSRLQMDFLQSEAS